MLVAMCAQHGYARCLSAVLLVRAALPEAFDKFRETTV